MFKKLLLITFVGCLSFSAMAEEIKDKDIVIPSNQETHWSSVVMGDTLHPFWQRQACVAYFEVESEVPGQEVMNSIEVIALRKQNSEEWTQPFVQVSTANDRVFTKKTYELRIGSRRFNMVETSQAVDGVVGFVSMHDDAEELVKALRNGNRATMTLEDTQGTVETLTFRLRGSSKAISTMENKDNCNLGYQEIVVPELIPLISNPTPQ